MNRYRYPSESVILALTVVAIIVAVGLTAGATVCIAPLVLLAIVLMSYWQSKQHHNELMQAAQPVTPTETPRLAELVADSVTRLNAPPVQTYVVRSNQRNAYTFGLTRPNVVVLYSSLFQLMDEDEIRFIVGHELGHVALGHTWLNTVLGGMGGVPVSLGAAIILTFAFRWWNRACEYSCDRAGLIACGNLNKAISALVKLAAGDVDTEAELQAALQMVEAEDDSTWNLLANTLSTHPLIAQRIAELRKFAISPEYRALFRS